MFECLRKKLTHTPAYPHFLSLLQHALLLPRKFIHLSVSNESELTFGVYFSSRLWVTSVPLAHVWSNRATVGSTGGIKWGHWWRPTRNKCERNCTIVSLLLFYTLKSVRNPLNSLKFTFQFSGWRPNRNCLLLKTKLKSLKKKIVI